jgi:hypothetical protein
MNQLHSLGRPIELLERLDQCARGRACAPDEDSITRTDEGDRVRGGNGPAALDGCGPAAHYGCGT